jgi:branched-chain amino acid transport system substrate-binding protein
VKTNSGIKRLVLLMVFAAILLWGCGEAPQNTIRIGVFAPLSGANMTYGQSCQNGVLMAVDEANAQGGLNGKQFELIIRDDQSRADSARTEVKQLIEKEKVIAVIGGVTSANSMAAAPVCQKLDVPMITPAATSPEVTEVGDCIFRVCFIDPFQGDVMAIFAYRSLKLKRVAILEDRRSEYSNGLARYFRQKFEELGGTIVADENYAAGDAKFTDQIAVIKDANPEAVFVPGYYQEVGLIAVQARAAGLTVPLLGGDGWNSPRTLELAGDALDGCFFSDHFTTSDPRPEVQTFIKKYEERFGATPDAIAPLSYDAAGMLISAMRQTGSAGVPEPGQIRSALASVTDYAGVTGPISIDADRNAQKPAVVMQIRDGAFVRITVLPAALGE